LRDGSDVPFTSSIGGACALAMPSIETLIGQACRSSEATECRLLGDSVRVQSGTEAVRLRDVRVWRVPRWSLDRTLADRLFPATPTPTTLQRLQACQEALCPGDVELVTSVFFGRVESSAGSSDGPMVPIAVQIEKVSPLVQGFCRLSASATPRAELNVTVVPRGRANCFPEGSCSSVDEDFGPGWTLNRSCSGGGEGWVRAETQVSAVATPAEGEVVVTASERYTVGGRCGGAPTCNSGRVGGAGRIRPSFRIVARVPAQSGFESELLLEGGSADFTALACGIRSSNGSRVDRITLSAGTPAEYDVECDERSAGCLGGNPGQFSEGSGLVSFRAVVRTRLTNPPSCRVEQLRTTEHCGRCGNRCRAPFGGTVECIGGRCVRECPAGQTLVGDACRAGSVAGGCGGTGLDCPTSFRCDERGECSTEARDAFNPATWPAVPSTAWTFGYRAPNDRRFVAYDVQRNISGTLAWTSAIGVDPNVRLWTGSSVGPFGDSPNSVAFHPGPQGQQSVVRFLPPRAGRYDIAYRFRSRTATTTVGVSCSVARCPPYGSLLFDGAAYFEGVWQNFDVSTGDAIDVFVDSRGEYSSDTMSIEVLRAIYRGPR
jgi:hypothetical protein